MNMSLDWSALLQSDLGLSQLNFRNLLHHRHDMQDDAYLEDNEKRLVDALRKNYDRECDSSSSS